MKRKSSPLRRYVAFLRAINVGGHTVKMDRLRTLFESVGHANVTTVIASGNVIFDSPVEDAPGLERQLEQKLAEVLGYAVDTFIRSTDEVVEIARYEPFAAPLDAGSHALNIAFLSSPPGKEAQRKLTTFRTRLDASTFMGVRCTGCDAPVLVNRSSPARSWKKRWACRQRCVMQTR
ncbi:MAG: DUF1697 domain-containing protein [Gemmatimonadaceae bacterium]